MPSLGLGLSLAKSRKVEPAPLPPPPDEFRVLGLHCDGANGSTTFTDVSPLAHTITAVGNAQVSTTNPKFGTGSLLVDGTSDYLSIPAHEGFSFGTGDFTIATWIKTTDNNGDILSQFVGQGTGYMVLLLFGGDCYWQVGAVNLLIRSATAILDGNWHHLAVTRSSGDIRMFFDGVQQGATVNSSAATGNAATGIRIGSGFQDLGANLDDILAHKGEALWTSDFTPPTGAFT